MIEKQTSTTIINKTPVQTKEDRDAIYEAYLRRLSALNYAEELKITWAKFHGKDSDNTDITIPGARFGDV